MPRAAGRFLAPTVLATALALSPALGYATTFVLLGLAALATVWWLWPPPPPATPVPLPRSAVEDPGTAGARTAVPEAPSLRDPPPRSGGGGPGGAWWRGRPHAPNPATPLFLLAFALITLSALLSGADLTPLLGFTALLFHEPLRRLLDGNAPLARPALIGTATGLATALVLHFMLGQSRAGEGFVLTDPYRLAVTTLVCATLALGALFTDAPGRRLAPLGLVAALIVIALTGSRTALLGLPVLLLVTALCCTRRPGAIASILAVTAALVVAALFVELPGTARTRLWDVLAGIVQGREVGDVAVALRLALYRLGMEQFWSSPLFGHGWSEANMAPILARLSPEQLSWGKLVHLHDDALQFALSGGLIGLAAWLATLVAPFAGYLALPSDAKAPAKLHAILVLTVGYLVLGLPDLMLASPLQLTLYVVLTAAVLGNAESRQTSPPQPSP